MSRSLIREKILATKAENPSWGTLKIARELGCGRSTVRWHVNEHCRNVQRKWTNAKYRKIKENLLAAIGTTGCVICGYNKYSGALEFHHKDPSQKDFTISELLHARKSLEVIKKELVKCVVLCATCHREVHGGITTLN